MQSMLRDHDGRAEEQEVHGRLQQPPSGALQRPLQGPAENSAAQRVRLRRRARQLAFQRQRGRGLLGDRVRGTAIAIVCYPFSRTIGAIPLAMVLARGLARRQVPREQGQERDGRKDQDRLEQSCTGETEHAGLRVIDRATANGRALRVRRRRLSQLGGLARRAVLGRARIWRGRAGRPRAGERGAGSGRRPPSSACRRVQQSRAENRLASLPWTAIATEQWICRRHRVIAPASTTAKPIAEVKVRRFLMLPCLGILCLGTSLLRQPRRRLEASKLGSQSPQAASRDQPATSIKALINVPDGVDDVEGERAIAEHAIIGIRGALSSTDRPSS